MAEFILFNRLSVEIRLTIWELAVRTDDKCAHFFTIKQFKSSIVSISGCQDELSAFDHDAGMWTACREYREVCLRAYRKLQRQSMPGVMDPGTMHQYSIKSEPEMVGTVLPRDLIVLRVQQRDYYPLRSAGMHAEWSRMLPLTHGDIAIDYDPAWVTGYRRQCGRSFADVQMQGTALGFCVRLLSGNLRPERTIWLLDRYLLLPPE